MRYYSLDQMIGLMVVLYVDGVCWGWHRLQPAGFLGSTGGELFAFVVVGEGNDCQESKVWICPARQVTGLHIDKDGKRCVLIKTYRAARPDGGVALGDPVRADVQVGCEGACHG